MHINRVSFRENISAFCRDKQNCPLYTGFRSKRMSLERGSSAVLQGERKGNHEEHIRIPKQIAFLSPEKKNQRKLRLQSDSAAHCQVSFTSQVT